MGTHSETRAAGFVCELLIENFIGLCTVLGFMVSFLYDVRHESSALPNSPSMAERTPLPLGNLSQHRAPWNESLCRLGGGNISLKSRSIYLKNVNKSMGSEMKSPQLCFSNTMNERFFYG